ncbi:hypothetical protein Tco_1306404, partial [Tanacetum coccineum]
MSKSTHPVLEIFLYLLVVEGSEVEGFENEGFELKGFEVKGFDVEAFVVEACFEVKEAFVSLSRSSSSSLVPEKVGYEACFGFDADFASSQMDESLSLSLSRSSSPLFEKGKPSSLEIYSLEISSLEIVGISYLITLAQLATKGDLGEVVTTCERSLVRVSSWEFSFKVGIYGVLPHRDSFL